MRRRALGAVLLLMAAVLSGCGSGGSGDASGPQTRVVQVDYRHDEFETAMAQYYPLSVTVRQGDTVQFKQAWTGEPHSVTMGALMEPKLKPIFELLRKVERTGEIPKEEPKEFQEFNFPGAFAEDEETGTEVMAQNAAQPCYVDEATEYPGDAKTPCPKREQPAFNGRQAIYNSGLIPYEGVKGNTFEMKIAEDATPGTYTYYCNVHFAVQSGQITIAEKGADIPSAKEVAKQARVEAEQTTSPLLRNWKAAQAGKPIKAGDPGMEETIETKGRRWVGLPAPFFDGETKTFVHGIVNEFVPREFTAKVGEKVTWTFDRGHTLSFNVPSYFPIFTLEPDGSVKLNPKASEPAGWPGPPEQEGGGDGPPGGEGGGEGGPPDREGGGEGGPPGEGEGEGGGPPPREEPVKVDAGTWDGKGFRSTGLDYPSGAEFSVTFTKPGTYPYACLIHPKMVGKLTVK